MAEIVALRFEHHPSGLGVQCSIPRISWKLSAVDESVSDWTQSQYEIAVRRSPGSQPERFTINSSDSSWLPWPSTPLISREQAQVRVRAYGSWTDRTTRRTHSGWATWSSWATVECSLLSSQDWIAEPISSPSLPTRHKDEPLRPLLFRKPFALPVNFGTVHRARLYITALGVYRAYLNGSRIGDHEMAPGWTSYHHRWAYQVFDVSSLITTTGKNVLGVEVAEGWFAGRLGFDGGKRYMYGDQIGVLAQLEVDGPGGERFHIASDLSWKCHASPLVRSEIYNGEVYDMRDEVGHWHRHNHDYLDAHWDPVCVLGFPLARLFVPNAHPVRSTQEVAPKRIFTTPAGRIIIDFGQNLVGKLWIRSLTLPANASVTFTHAEVMENDGELGTRALRDAQCADTVISSGQPLVDWSPKFTFHGFRFVQVDGWDPQTESSWQDNIRALVIHTDFAQTGWFTCSNADINQLHQNACWSMRGNFLSIPTDCPQRDERLGWTGDIQVFSPSATFLYDSVGMLSDWMEDVACEQSDHRGIPPLVVPNILDHVWPSIPQAVWDDVVIIVPWVLYLSSGDRDILDRQYPSMTAWLDQGVRRGKDGLWDPELWQLGDWLDPQAPPDEPGDTRTNGTLVADAYLVHVTSLMADISSILEKEAESIHYRLKAHHLRRVFQDKYITATGLMVGDSQTAYALAVVFKLFRNHDQLAEASRRLALHVRTAKFRVATGFVGTPVILRALTDTDNLSLAYRMLLEDSCPSWLYPITMGATTIWERWDSMLPNGSINPGQMTSFNHYALGSVVNWLHETVGGIRPLDAGWKTALVCPQPGGPLTHATVSYESTYGRWSCQWELVRDGAGDVTLSVDLTVPPNCRAVVRIRATESGPSNLETVVGSGKHQWRVRFFPSPWPPQAIAPFVTNPGKNFNSVDST
ncbi:bacterial alpha-L-rhamnosidase-domain-containing protein [Talaromyces proteolyticus]|uniref:alpha-L-rhamnosidase n=1 Tax=Talaromyces proteolyticus TaxID=1131652 RepID=A0AAD4KJL5_9EURO|nr:bacterial alpha-L-rhamnosidase-domain-containing protein [Talaromyces proteolyticus]KAH8692578.1 bacterial alpha-L-rhamnosidase-domain-containing protein [Talaromyces proteolyticus]